ncbi:hypothetical protein MTO96_035150 [Rhipicephalus appendiculatus]
MTSTIRHCDEKQNSRADVGQPEAAAAPSSSRQRSRVCSLRHRLPVDMEASADEIVAMLHAYDAIEEEIDDVEHHTTSLLLAQVMRQYRHHVPLYVARDVPEYVDLELRKMFERSRSTLQLSWNNFRSLHFIRRARAGRTKVSAEKAVLIGRRYLGTRTTMHAIADKLDVSGVE